MFLFVAEYYSAVCVDLSFVYSCVGWWIWGGFRFLAGVSIERDTVRGARLGTSVFQRGHVSSLRSSRSVAGMAGADRGAGRVEELPDFSIGAAPSHVLPGHGGRFWFPHLLTRRLSSDFLLVAVLVDVKSCPPVVLVCVPLTAEDVENFPGASGPLVSFLW